MSASLEVTFLLWFALIAVIGFWCVKLLFGDVVGEIFSQLRNGKRE